MKNVVLTISATNAAAFACLFYFTLGADIDSFGFACLVIACFSFLPVAAFGATVATEQAPKNKAQARRRARELCSLGCLFLVLDIVAIVAAIVAYIVIVL